MSDKGWIKTYRKILDCWLWTSKEPYDRRSAWMYLLLTANHSDKKIMFNGEFITVKRGQILTSIRTLAEKWKWSYDKTLRFLRTIESDGMIEKESDNFRTLITIVNYEVFQDTPNADRTPISEQSSEHTSERISEQTSDKQEYKELKNVKNVRINNNPPLSPHGETGDKNRKKESTVYYPNDEKLNSAFLDYMDMRKKIKKPMTDRAVTLAMKKLQKLSTVAPSTTMDNDLAIMILEESTMNCWQSLYPLKNGNNGGQNGTESKWINDWRNA